MKLRTWITAPILAALLACATDTGSASDGTCVPGASAMCWCDGETPGVQECQSDMAYAPCICDGSAGTGEGPDPDDGDSAPPDDADDDTAGSNDQSTTNSPEGTSSENESDGTADGDSGDPVPTDCTDELFSLWQACRQLASLNNPSDCGPCVGGNVCENAACNIDCAEQGNPGFETDLADCDSGYPQCAGIFDQPADPYSACTQMCGLTFNNCVAALAPECDSQATGTCSSEYSACVNGC